MRISDIKRPPSFYYPKVNYLLHPGTGDRLPESAWCAIPFQDMEQAKIPLIMMIATTAIFFVVPLVLVATLYCR